MRALRFVATLLAVVPASICYVVAYTCAVIFLAAKEGWTEGRQ